MDIGESIVGAYMRYIRECEVVVYNTFLRDQQGELDVIALKTSTPRKVWLGEVTTHIGGMLYPGASGADGIPKKLRDKLQRECCARRGQRTKLRATSIDQWIAHSTLNRIVPRIKRCPLPSATGSQRVEARRSADGGEN